MTAKEVIRRIRDRVVKESLRARVRTVKELSSKTRTPFPELPDPMVFADAPVGAVSELLETAERLLSGRWTTLGVERDDMAPVPDWFLDPLTRLRSPQHAFAFSIDHRSSDLVGSAKHVWETSRHQHLTVLASAYAVSGDDRYARAVDRHLRDWWSCNAPLRGMHWLSGIELGLRLVSWVWVRRLLAGWEGVELLFEENDIFAKQLYWHQKLLALLPSHGSSANNHLIAEMTGLFVASSAFDWFEESPHWRIRSAEELTRALRTQTAPSGLNRELATDYHGFVLELALVAGVEDVLADATLGVGYWDVLERMFDALAAMVDARLRPPRQGDSEGGAGLLIDSPGFDEWSSLLATGAAILPSRRWWPEVTRADIRSHVLTAALLDAKPPANSLPVVPPDLADMGMVIMASRRGEPDELWIRCDGGPLGYLATAAHGHAGALSIEIRHGGIDILADPGTYCYGEHPSWRTYFRSTAAHNTIEIGGENQAVDRGTFLWSSHPTVEHQTETSSDGRQRWTARHDGYRRLAVPVTHVRTVELSARSATVRVSDRIEADGPIDGRLLFHLGPRVDCTLDGGLARLTWETGSEVKAAMVRLPERLSWTAVRGATDPIFGWYSRSYGTKTPAWTLIGAGRMSSDVEMVTLIEMPTSTALDRTAASTPELASREEAWK